MCATKMSCVRIQQISSSNMGENQPVGHREVEEEREGSDAAEYQSAAQSSYYTANRQLSTRPSERDTRTLSVPNLLNLGNDPKDLYCDDSEKCEKEDKNIRGGVTGAGLSSQDTDVKTYVTGTRSDMDEEVAKQRQNSIDSLMRAAVTVEKNDHTFKQIYQNKISSIIDLKNQISDEIRYWPSVKASGTEKSIHSLIDPKDKIQDITLSDISPEDLNSLKNVANTLHATVRELDELKNRQPTHNDAPRQTVRLPSMEMLTSNITDKSQIALQGYQFPNERFGGNPQQAVKQSVEPHFVASSSSVYQRYPYVQHHPPTPGNYVPYAWAVPNAPSRINHRVSVSDPVGYRLNMIKGSEDGTDANNQNLPSNHATASSSSSIIFQPPYGSTDSNVDKSPSKYKFKSKGFKSHAKTQRSSSETLLTNNHQSLAHGLIMAETIRKNEQSTTSCVHCGEASTPEWRRGPYGNRTLCNACGLFYRKLVKRFGNKDANIFMRFRKKTNSEDRRVPTILDVPLSFREELENDKNLDADYFTVGGANSNFIFTESKK